MASHVHQAAGQAAAPDDRAAAHAASGSVVAPARIFSRMRWVIIFLLFLGAIISYLDRAALSIAAPMITQEFGLNPAQLGIVFSSFFFGYALFSFVGGFAADRIGGKRVFNLSMSVWSVFCGLTAACFNIPSLLIVRTIFGMGEGPFGSAANKIVSEWFPRREQASAAGVANSGTPLGGALAGPIVGGIALTLGWRISFVVIALIGLVWVAAWMRFSADRPADHRGVSAAERQEIAADHAAMPSIASASLGFYVRQPAVLATAFAFFGFSYILFFFLSWFPTYLTTTYHMSLQRMSIVSSIPWALGFIGMAGGGFVSDFIFRLTGKALFSRKLVLIVCLMISAICVALAGIASSVQEAVALMAVSVFFMYMTANTYWSIILALVEPGKVGGVSGFVHFLANIAGIIAPAATGFLVQSTGTFVSAFVLAGSFAVLGALLVGAFVRPISSVPANGVR
jgi:MFS transporter, ACS family, hexuronate transporter